MRPSLTPAVPPSMYRHFAVVTVLLTAILAMFAEGENRQAQAAPAARQAPSRPTEPRIVVSRQATQPAPEWWEVDSFSDGETGGMPGTDSGVVPGFEDIDEPDDPPDYPASLSEDERGRLLAGMHESGVPGPAANGD